MGDLELLYHPFSSFSQRVIMALDELQLPYSKKIVNLPNSENEEGWFMKINPKGQVPVLRDGADYIIDSAQIIKHLDSKYGSGKLLRTGQPGEELVQSVIEHISSVDIFRITFGSYFHPDLSCDRGYADQFGKMTREKISTGARIKKLEEECKKNPDMLSIYEEKIKFDKDRAADVSDREKLVAALEKCKSVLTIINGHLEDSGYLGSTGERWLVDEKLTLADICLAVLLSRLVFCGFAKFMWKDGQLPSIEKYLENLRKTETYRKTTFEKHKH